MPKIIAVYSMRQNYWYLVTEVAVRNKVKTVIAHLKQLMLVKSMSLGSWFQIFTLRLQKKYLQMSLEQHAKTSL